MKKGRRVRDVFFRAAAESALTSYKEHGRVDVPLLALIHNKREYELMPVSTPISETPFDGALDAALSPVIDYVLDNDARVVSFFLSTKGRGTVLDSEGNIDDVDVIINAARTEENKGKTLIAKITGSALLDYEILTPPGGDGWSTKPAEEDLPAVTAQRMLSAVWMTYLVEKSIKSAGKSIS